MDAELTALAQPNPDPNDYQVRLDWSSNVEPTAWVVLRAVGEDQPRVVATLDSGQRSFIDEEVEPNTSYNYVLASLQAGEFEKVSQTKVKTAQDLVVTGVLKTDQVLGFHRVFLLPGGRIITNGTQFKMVADEIISNGGSIESFQENQKAPQGESGRPGGTITIRAKRGSGTLRIHARGEHGGNGKDGQPGARGRPGSRGRSGICKKRAVMHPERQYVRYYVDECKSQPTNGGRGGRGRDGANGQQGGDGGDTARVLVEIKDPTGFEVKATTSVGTGGNGGIGGSNGRGGPGGAPGLQGCGECRPAHAGASGPSGKSGSHGASGKHGNELPICLRMGAAVFGDCASFAAPNEEAANE